MSLTSDDGIFSDDDETNQGGVPLQPESFVPTTPTGWEPERQPIGPPNELVVQKFAGFARFLKEHTSPRSKRVTAGGRIVPAGPNSPPPTFDMGFIDSIVKQSEEVAKSPERSETTTKPSLQGKTADARAGAKGAPNTTSGESSQHDQRDSRGNNRTTNTQTTVQRTEGSLGNPATSIYSALDVPSSFHVYQVLDGGNTAIVGSNGSFFRVHLTDDGLTKWDILQSVAAYPPMAGFVQARQDYFGNMSAFGFPYQPMMFPQGMPVHPMYPLGHMRQTLSPIFPQ